VYLDVNVNIAERLGAARKRVARIGQSRAGEGNGAALNPPALIIDTNLDGQERG